MRRYYVRLKCVIKIFFFFFFYFYYLSDLRFEQVNPIDKINNQNLSCLYDSFLLTKKYKICNFN